MMKTYMNVFSTKKERKKDYLLYRNVNFMTNMKVELKYTCQTSCRSYLHV